MGTILFAAAASSLAGDAVVGCDDHDHGDHLGHPDPFGFNLSDHWLDPWVHLHLSPTGAPLIHNFGFEPAFLGREFFATYGRSELDEGDEHEIELELEWALTRRIGIVVEQPYIFEEPDGEPSADGFGDLAVVPRFVLTEFERFIASLNVEVEVPTGSSSVGAGGEWHIAPFLSTWLDLGDWWALTSAGGVEFALDSNEKELFLALGLSKAFRIHDAERFSSGSVGHDHELPAGVLALIAELYLEGVIDGEEDEEDIFAFEGLVGLNYTMNSFLTLRAAYAFPLNGNSELDGGVRTGFICHF